MEKYKKIERITSHKGITTFYRFWIGIDRIETDQCVEYNVILLREIIGGIVIEKRDKIKRWIQKTQTKKEADKILKEFINDIDKGIYYLTERDIKKVIGV